MSQRLLTTKWLCYLLALQAGSLWGHADSITVQTPPSNPSTVEAQAKFFQDFFSVQLSPHKIEFGHVCEDPSTWEQRYESKDFKNHRDMGKVRWGDKKGGYGEHYWDLNHAGHAGNHGNDGYDGDDGSYHEPSNSHSYDDRNNNSPNYSDDEYDPDKASYEESGRAKRAHPKVKVERKSQKSESYDEEPPRPYKKHRKNKEQLQAEATHQVEEYPEEDEDEEEEEEEEIYEKPKPRRQKYRKHEGNPTPKEKNQVVLVVSQKDDSEKQPSEYVPKKQPELAQYVSKKQPEQTQYITKKKPEVSHYVPYEGGAGVRQHQQPEVIPVKTVPRLFLEPSTGHVVDRATGQAYVLQPIAVNNYN